MQLISNRTRIIRAMGKQGFRRPGSMIAKIVDDEVKKIAKKEGKSYQAMKENLLSAGQEAAEW